jgi:hypothetical protein
MTVERRAGRWFRWILGAEVAFLVGGLQLVRALGAAAPSRVGWIAFVVGLHFVRLALAWRAASIAIPGALVLAPGVAGLAFAPAKRSLAAAIAEVRQQTRTARQAR